MSDRNTVRVVVSGDYACFTRPDLKVERMTYPCMTPSAARGVLDSILWKPEFQWHVMSIAVLKPIRFASIKRNELNEKQGKKPLEIADKRAQRNSIILKDVSYLVTARIHQEIEDRNNPPAKYVAMFNRRVSKGQCYRRPFLGCREFSAEFHPVNQELTPISDEVPIGSMLLDIYFDEKGRPRPKFFYDVAVRNGVIDCEESYREMLTSSHVRPERGSEINAVLYEFDRLESVEGA